ncbi:ROK family protein [Candidatus Sulfurimonas marisnigri]|uniref:ROK family protein n=1 Tax=Candidatus Sulfurimonas marisnigri TaxID=2740405 RepID=A0A7S7RQN1_9BACT|nr:ROK family protein [Candidatus Sulfurimonas marisnigri]QOY54851.1 ROK family protein [Candidatus Sulfurimonas marisnigri]
MNLAIDVGGSNLRAQIWDANVHIDSMTTKSKTIGVAEWIESILNKHKRISTIGIAYAGQVEDGCIISAPNLNIDKKDIKSFFESNYDVTLKIENDLTCAVMAEANYHNSKNICALYLGTGLGLGVVESGKILRGSHNIAAELGHIPYKEAPFRCGCGRSNCIELFASGIALKNWVQHYALDCNPSLSELKKISEERITDTFEEALLYASATAITIFNPDVLVLGGGIVSANPYLKDLITKNIDKYALPQSLKDIEICISNIDDAPLQGALLLKDYND